MKNEIIFNREILIGNKIISKTSPTFVIAEAGVNHNGDMQLARELIDIASNANADAVKFQSFRADNLILKNVKKANYQLKNTNNTESQYEMLKKLELGNEQMLELCDYAKKNNIILVSTPFDEDSLVELEQLNLPCYKIASTDATNLPFLIKFAQTGKPLILSTGMTYLDEIKYVLNELTQINKDIILLHCTANYPTSAEDVNLNVLNTYKREFDAILGFSDHTVGLGASPYSVTLGAKVVEKHFTINKDFDGPDQQASLSPDELKQFVQEIRKVEKYMGHEFKMPTLAEQDNRKSLQKCLVAKTNIQKNTEFTEYNIIAKRTGGEGISPLYFKNILGKNAPKDFKTDDLIYV